MTVEKALRILRALRENGQEAFIVGGAVRDYLLGVAPQDIDIATAAHTQEIIATAQRQGWRTIETGVFFGVVVVVVEGAPYDVATFRTETYGADCHRPEKVCFAVSLREDLSRRDFSINAMAMDDTGNIIDYFNGQEDLRIGLIRTVGDPLQRFQEDALRMFRAARFASVLNFTIDAGTLAAIPPNLYRVRGLSVERVRSEIDKTLLGRYAPKGLRVLMEQGLLNETCRARDESGEENVPILPELSHLSGLAQNERYHRLDVWEHTLSMVEQIMPHPVLRWAALLHDIAKGLPEVRIYNAQGDLIEHRHEVAGAQIAVHIAKRLRFPAYWSRSVPWLVRHHLRLPPAEEEACIRWLRRRSREFKRSVDLKEGIEALLEIHRTDRLAGHRDPCMPGWERIAEVLRQILESVPFYPDQLALTGEEIAESLGRGPVVGQFQRTLLARIQTGELLNTRQDQIDALIKRIEREKQKNHVYN
jgi:putative nucleotidyltransferase with HDIG domain